MASGLSNRAIAETLFVSENTVRTHLKAVFRKLGVTSRGQAATQRDGRELSYPPIGPSCTEGIPATPNLDKNGL